MQKGKQTFCLACAFGRSLALLGMTKRAVYCFPFFPQKENKRFKKTFPCHFDQREKWAEGKTLKGKRNILFTMYELGFTICLREYLQL